MSDEIEGQITSRCYIVTEHQRRGQQKTKRQKMLCRHYPEKKKRGCGPEHRSKSAKLQSIVTHRIVDRELCRLEWLPTINSTTPDPHEYVSM